MAKLKDTTKIYKMFTDSESYMEQYTTNFDENERLKEGSAKTSIPANYPRVTDKSLSKQINDKPKQVFQKLPEFLVDAKADKATDIGAEYILNEVCIRGEDEGLSFYQKLINTGRDSCGFGVCAVYSPFELVNGSYRVGFEPIYWADLFMEPYSTNVNTNNYNFIRQWKTEADLEAIIDDTDPDVDNGWNVANLKKMLSGEKTTSQDKPKPGDRRAGVVPNMYEFITYCSKDEFITFSYDNRLVLRERSNKGKRRRIVGLYYDFDGVNPLGRSMVDIAGDLQNLIDADMQAYQFNRALALQPPVIVSGDIDGGDGIYMPNNVIVADDPETAVKPIVVDSTAVTAYPNLYSLQKSQMNNLLPDSGNTTITAEATGGISSSKTPTGIAAVANKESLDNNFFFKNAEAFLGAWARNALNIYFAQFDGVVELQLNNEYANRVREEDPSKVTDDNIMQIDCSDFSLVDVKVVPDSIRDVTRDEDMKRLITLINMAGQSEQIVGIIGFNGMKEIAKGLVKTSGVSNAGDIIKAINENQQMMGDPNAEQQAPGGGVAIQ